MNNTTLTIERLSHEGRGIAHLEGKTVFVDGALPSEQVEYAILKKRRKFLEAKAEKILDANAARVTPPCPHFTLCGGCSLQHMETSQQIKHKENVLIEQLQHFGKLTPDHIAPPLTGPTQAYRRRARLGVRYVIKKEKVLVGFREKRSHYLADINSCYILPDKISQLIMPLRELIYAMEARTTIPQIELACADNGTALVFRHLEPLAKADRQALEHFAQQHSLILYAQAGSPLDVQLIYPSSHDPLYYALEDYDLKIYFSPLDFIQINADINQKMISQALSWLNPAPHEQVLDLYAGLGNFTLALAKFAHQVTAIEGEPRLVHGTQQNAKANQLTNIECLTRELNQPHTTPPWPQTYYDAVLLDPARSGAEHLAPHLVASNAKRILYVSCDPATLARDANLLVSSKQYRLAKVGVMDMFPHTSHVESMALFERQG